MGGRGHRREAEHEVRDDRAYTRAGHLRRGVHDAVAGGDATEETVGQGHDGVEVTARHRAEREDQRDEPGTGDRSVDQQLQTDLTG